MPAVFVHGNPETAVIWEPLLAELGRKGTICLSPPGFGSPVPAGFGSTRLEYGDWLIRELEKVGEPVDLVGHDWGGLIGWTVTALHPRLVRSLAVLGGPHPLAVRSAIVRDPRGQGLATVSYALGFQVPRLPERTLLADGGARVERIMAAWAGPEWAATADFAEAAEQCRRAIQVPGVAHCAMEYYRWAFRSQARPDGRRFAAAVARPAAVPVLQIHGADDPCLLPRTAAASTPWAGPDHRLHVLPDTGHFPHQERPGVTTGLLAEFLAR